MSVKPQFVCDICGAQRQDTNHWFLAELLANGILQLTPWELPQSEGYREQPQIKHLCGQTCAHKLFDAWMSGVSK